MVCMKEFDELQDSYHIRTGGYEFKFDDPNEEECLEGEEWRDVDDALLECSDD